MSREGVRKRIAITMGEPGGVGPEVVVKALNAPVIRDCGSPLVIGSVKVMEEAVKLTGLPFMVRAVSSALELKAEPGTIDVLEVKSLVSKRKGEPSKSAGIAVVKYVEKAVELALKNEVSAIVTAPISKESLKLAGHAWPGHTELLAGLTNTKDYAMMFVSEKLKVILCTIHTALREVPKRINRNLVSKTITLAVRGAGMLGIKAPGIAVAGLNPHAGEAGIMGSEEIKSIIPAIEDAKKLGIHATGPYPPDVVFHRAYNGEFDMIVCMYHDQGLIPFKMLAFDTGINVTVGLPIIRTSPDHGTAFDIAWKNMAEPTSMIKAIRLAGELELRGWIY